MSAICFPPTSAIRPSDATPAAILERRLGSDPNELTRGETLTAFAARADALLTETRRVLRLPPKSSRRLSSPVAQSASASVPAAIPSLAQPTHDEQVDEWVHKCLKLPASELAGYAKFDGALGQAALIVDTARNDMMGKSDAQLRAIGEDSSCEKLNQILAWRELEDRKSSWPATASIPTTTYSGATCIIHTAESFEEMLSTERGLSRYALAACRREEATGQAGREWDSHPSVRDGFKTKENYVGYKTAILNGTHKGAVGSTNARAVHTFTDARK